MTFTDNSISNEKKNKRKMSVLQIIIEVNKFESQVLECSCFSYFQRYFLHGKEFAEKYFVSLSKKHISFIC